MREALQKATLACIAGVILRLTRMLGARLDRTLLFTGPDIDTVLVVVVFGSSGTILVKGLLISRTIACKCM